MKNNPELHSEEKNKKGFRETREISEADPGVHRCARAGSSPARQNL
jgi:hypothetical protein